MARTFPEFTLPVRAAYQDDGSAKGSFLAAVDGMVNDGKRKFREFSDEARRSMAQAMSGAGGQVAFRFDLSGFRQAAAEAELSVQKFRAMRDAAIGLAERTGDTRRETHLYIQSLRGQVSEAERAKTIADAQVTTYSRLQNELERVVAGQRRLAEAYRETYAEQARAENTAFRSQRDVNAQIAPTLAGQRATDNGAGYRALEQFARYSDQADALRMSLDPTIAIQRRFDDELARASSLFNAGAISAREYSQAQGLARQNLQDGWAALTRANAAATAGARANALLAESQRGVRIAGIGAGQQLQDIAISLQGGQRASLVFAQQLPQLGFALSALDGNANKTLGRIGALGTTLAGPWGLAVVGATFLAGPLIDKLFGMSEASEKAERAAKRHADVLDFQKMSTTELTEAIKDQLATAEKSIQSEYQQAAAARKTAEENLNKAIATREATKATLEAVKIAQAGAIEIPGVTDGLAGASLAKRGFDLEIELKAQQTNIDNLRTVQRIRDSIVAKMDVAAGNDPTKARDRQLERDVAQLTAFRNAHTGIFANARDEAALYRSELDKLTDARDRDVKAIQEQAKAERAAGRETRETARFALPIAGASITSGFGPRRAPTAGASTFHPAIDLAAPIGTAVHAPQVGTVTAIGFDRGLGKYVVLDHGGGTTSRFGHLSDNSVVTEGQLVQKGDVIGKTGNTGRSTGPHLDYQVKVNGRPVDPRKGVFPIDPTHVAEAAESAQKILDNFGDKASEHVARITEAFDDQPRAIDRAAQATRELQKIFDGLKAKNLLDPDAEKAIATATAAVNDSLSRPFRNMLEEQQRGLDIQRLTSAGREEEAEVLQLQNRLMDMLGIKQRESLMTELAKYGVSKDQYGQMIRNLVAARQYDREQQRFLDAQRRQLDQISTLRSSVTQTVLDFRTEGLGAFGGLVSRLQNQFDDFFANDLVERLFGGAFQSMEDVIRNAKQVEADASTTAARHLLNLADAASAASASLEQKFDQALGGGAANDNGTAALRESLNQIVVYSRDYSNPRTLFSMMTTKLADSLFDEKTSKRLGKEIGGALEGAAYGRIGGSIALGGKSSALGSSIGGIVGQEAGEKLLGKALGSFAGPVGGIVGGILGGLVGGLFKKTPYGSAAISNGNVSIAGNSSDAKSGASSAADSVNMALQRIVDQLGGKLGNYAVSIGLTNGNWNVNPGLVTGKIGTTKQRDTIDFKKDQAAALSWAIKNAIEDGAIQGVRAGTSAILKAAKDIDRGVQDALDFESIFSRLKAYNDPAGAALDTLDKEFSRLRGLAVTAGEGMVELEELYGKERAKVLKETNDRLLGTLRGLYDDLRIGDNGLSLRDRLGAARAQYDPLAARVRAGDATAFDDFAQAGRSVLDLTRQIYGSQEGYFSFFDELKDLTKQTLDAQQAAIDAATGRDNPFTQSAVPTTDNASIVSAIDQMNMNITDAITAGFLATNQNLGALITQSASNSNWWTPLSQVGTGGNF